LIIKFFLHISKKEQKKRFEKLTSDPLTAWRVAPEDWEHHRRYKEWLLAYEETFEQTESEWAPWTIVEATDRRYTQVKIYKTIVRSLEKRMGLKPLVLPGEETHGVEKHIKASDKEESVVEQSNSDDQNHTTKVGGN
jgi:hypothetical protein